MCSPMNSARIFVNTLIISGALCVMLPLLFILGPIYEGKHFPVTSGVKVELVKTEPDRMVLQAYGTKNRECSLTNIKVLVDANGDSKVTKGVVYLINDGVGDIVRPLGYQDFGIWAVHPIAKKVQVQTSYRCHFLWDTYQVLGEWSEKDVIPKIK